MLKDAVLHKPSLRGAAQPAPFSWVNLVFANETSGELQELLETIVQELWSDKVAHFVRTTHGCYEAAEQLPLLDKIQTF